MKYADVTVLIAENKEVFATIVRHSLNRKQKESVGLEQEKDRSKDLQSIQ